MKNIQQQISPNNPLCGELERLTKAFERRNYGMLTLPDIANLLDNRFISAETALRLAKEAGHVH